MFYDSVHSLISFAYLLIVKSLTFLAFGTYSSDSTVMSWNIYCKQVLNWRKLKIHMMQRAWENTVTLNKPYTHREGRFDA